MTWKEELDLLTKFHENNLGRRRFGGGENRMWRFEGRTVGRKPGEVEMVTTQEHSARAYLDVELARTTTGAKVFVFTALKVAVDRELDVSHAEKRFLRYDNETKFSGRSVMSSSTQRRRSSSS